MEKYDLHSEANLLGKYIIGKKINTETSEAYADSFSVSQLTISDNEQRILKKCIDKPYLLPYYDAALSIKNPNHLLKQKLLRMFAILETRPEYADQFLGRNFSRIYFLKIALVGVRAVLRTIVGLIILPKKYN